MILPPLLDAPPAHTITTHVRGGGFARAYYIIMSAIYFFAHGGKKAPECFGGCPEGCTFAPANASKTGFGLATEKRSMK